MNVSTIENSEHASFFESYEAAHSMRDLTSSIAKVMLFLVSMWKIYEVIVELNAAERAYGKNSW